MDRNRQPRESSGGAQLERELLARLGLPPDANSQEIATAYDEIASFLDGAPRDLRAWADREMAALDEAYALLSDPTVDLPASATPRPAPSIGKPAAAQGSRKRAAAAAAGVAIAASPAASDDEYIEELGEEPPRSGRQRLQAERLASARSRDGAAATSARPVWGRLTRRAGIAALVVVGVLAVVFVGYTAGAPSVPSFTGTPAPEAAASPGLDTAQVAELMKKLQASPKDVATLQALGDLYFDAADYKTAADWGLKIVEIDPVNLTAHLALGAALFNQGNSTDAEKHWREVLAIDPRNVEAHYDLGFMYLSKRPPDNASAKAEWDKVIEIAPDSTFAKSVAPHLPGLEGGGASPGPSGSPVPSNSPAAAPVTSPTPGSN
jgi:cytochrome c-type biogenesis protein CcmH/NrfG